MVLVTNGPPALHVNKPQFYVVLLEIDRCTNTFYTYCMCVRGSLVFKPRTHMPTLLSTNGVARYWSSGNERCVRDWTDTTMLFLRALYTLYSEWKVSLTMYPTVWYAIAFANLVDPTTKNGSVECSFSILISYDEFVAY